MKDDINIRRPYQGTFLRLRNFLIPPCVDVGYHHKTNARHAEQDTRTQSTRLLSLPMAIVLSLHPSISPLAYGTCATNHPRSCLSLARPTLFILLLSGPRDVCCSRKFLMARSEYRKCARTNFWRSGGDIPTASGVQNLRATIKG